MGRSEYLDKTERFIEWLEERRREAGLTQAELTAQSGAMSTSYYQRMVNLGTQRKNWGDDGRNIVAPTEPERLIRVMQHLSRVLGRDIVEEGLAIWGHKNRKVTAYHLNGNGHRNGNGNGHSKVKEVIIDNDDWHLATMTALKLSRLSRESLELVHNLVDKLMAS